MPSRTFTLASATLLAVLLAGCARTEPAASNTAATTASSSTTAAPATPDPKEAGWTGLTNPGEVIAARNEVMYAAEELMKPIDTLQVNPKGDLQALRANAKLLAGVLHAVPHLFPPTTNLFVVGDQYPKTLALPAIWVNFEHFSTQAESAIQAAEELSKVETMEAMRTGGAKLRANCDACHAGYLRKYELPKAQDSDYEFDFDAVLQDDSAAK